MTFFLIDVVGTFTYVHFGCYVSIGKEKRIDLPIEKLLKNGFANDIRWACLLRKSTL